MAYCRRRATKCKHRVAVIAAGVLLLARHRLKHLSLLSTLPVMFNSSVAERQNSVSSSLQKYDALVAAATFDFLIPHLACAASRDSAVRIQAKAHTCYEYAIFLWSSPGRAYQDMMFACTYKKM